MGEAANHFPESYTRGAKLLRDLQSLKPGECYRMHGRDLKDIEVPANPLDRQTPAFIAQWMQDRMPYYCFLQHSVFGDWWEISRPAETDNQQITASKK